MAGVIVAVRWTKSVRAIGRQMVTWEPTSELQDPALTAEIELLGDLIEAVTHKGRRLSLREIDCALGVGESVGENRQHFPRPTAATSASPQYDVAYEAAR